MEGVTIIDTIVHNSLNSSSFWCIAIGCLIFACATLLEMCHQFKHKHYAYVAGLCSVIAACVLVVGMAWHDSAFKEIKYIVTVDDTVNFNEFCNHYEIVSREGEQYVVKEVSAIHKRNI
jgi:hypothetical protein